MRRILMMTVFWALGAVVAQAAAAGEGEASSADLLTRGAAVVADIHARTEALEADSPHPLFTRHLRSVDALARADWARASLVVESNPTYARRSIEFAQKILEGLRGDAGCWDSYAAGRRSLIFAFVSKHDMTLQQYSLRLPTGWDASKSYPMIVYLHGYVPKAHPMWYTSLSFGPKKAPAAEAKETLEPHYSLGPWGRGNTMYRHAGETDVWEALADMRARFKVDDDRICLTGHSMGGFGTWAIGLRTPDRWAALGIYAGADEYAPAESGLAANVAGTPVLLWHGEKDPTVPVRCAHAMRAALRKFGNEAKMVLSPEAGHMVPGEEKFGLKKWLLQQRRTHPKRFSFIADTDRHRGVWGVVLRRDPMEDASPRFDCRIEGATVRIDSVGAKGLDVDLGAAGLGLTGDVTVVWNGDKAYEGPAEKIKLGLGAKRSWRD